jgi:hypothetical protein
LSQSVAEDVMFYYQSLDPYKSPHNIVPPPQKKKENSCSSDGVVEVPDGIHGIPLIY